MRLAIPNWNGRVSPVFDAASEVVVVDAAGGRAASRAVYSLPEALMPGRVERLKRLGVNLLICGGVSNPLRRMLEVAGMSVLPGHTGTVDEVLAAFLAGGLGDGRFAMPGRQGFGRGRRFRGGRGNTTRWPTGPEDL